MLQAVGDRRGRHHQEAPGGSRGRCLRKWLGYRRMGTPRRRGHDYKCGSPSGRWAAHSLGLDFILSLCSGWRHMPVHSCCDRCPRNPAFTFSSVVVGPSLPSRWPHFSHAIPESLYASLRSLIHVWTLRLSLPLLLRSCYTMRLNIYRTILLNYTDRHIGLRTQVPWTSGIGGRPMTSTVRFSRADID